MADISLKNTPRGAHEAALPAVGLTATENAERSRTAFEELKAQAHNLMSVEGLSDALEAFTIDLSRYHLKAILETASDLAIEKGLFDHYCPNLARQLRDYTRDELAAFLEKEARFAGSPDPGEIPVGHALMRILCADA